MNLAFGSSTATEQPVTVKAVTLECDYVANESIKNHICTFFFCMKYKFKNVCWNKTKANNERILLTTQQRVCVCILWLFKNINVLCMPISAQFSELNGTIILTTIWEAISYIWKIFGNASIKQIAPVMKAKKDSLLNIQWIHPYESINRVHFIPTFHLLHSKAVIKVTHILYIMQYIFFWKKFDWNKQL